MHKTTLKDVERLEEIGIDEEATFSKLLLGNVSIEAMFYTAKKMNVDRDEVFLRLFSKYMVQTDAITHIEINQWTQERIDEFLKLDEPSPTQRFFV